MIHLYQNDGKLLGFVFVTKFDKKMCDFKDHNRATLEVDHALFLQNQKFILLGSSIVLEIVTYPV